MDAQPKGELTRDEVNLVTPEGHQKSSIISVWIGGGWSLPVYVGVRFGNRVAFAAFFRQWQNLPEVTPISTGAPTSPCTSPSRICLSAAVMREVSLVAYNHTGRWSIRKDRSTEGQEDPRGARKERNWIVAGWMNSRLLLSQDQDWWSGQVSADASAGAGAGAPLSIKLGQLCSLAQQHIWQAWAWQMISRE